MVKEAAPCKYRDSQQLCQRVRASQDISDLRLFPVCQSADADANVPGDFTGGHMPCTKRYDSLTFQLRFKRCILIDRTGENKPSVGMTFINPASQLRIPMIPVSDSGDFDRASRAGYFLL